MSIGRYISLEEARRKKKLERFIKAHPSKGNKAKFEKLLGAMSKPKTRSKGKKTSSRE